MVNFVKRISCLALCLAIIFSFSGCSGNNEITEENVTKTVEKATIALQEFDIDDLNKYVDSETLSYILKFAENHEQFVTLGKAIFENLDIQIESIDIESKTVTVSVINKDMYDVASNFTRDLLDKHSKFQLLQLLSDDTFLDYSLSKLVDSISIAPMQAERTTVTLQIVQSKKNLVLHFDDDAEDAVSGGALRAIKSIIG